MQGIARRTIALPHLRLGVGQARRLSLLLAALGPVGLLGAWRARRAGERGHEPAGIRFRYGTLLVPVSDLDQRSFRELVQVPTIDALVRIADQYERMILHHAHAGGDAYLVIDDAVAHAYFVGERPAPQPPADIRPGKAHLGVVGEAA